MAADGHAQPVEQSAAVPDQHAARRLELKSGGLAVYGAGAMVDAISTFCLGSLLYFYMTAVCGLTGTEAGGALAIALVVDSAIDPVVGSISDNATWRFGRRHPLMLAATVPIFFGLGFLFSVPAGLKGVGLFAYATGLLLALRCGFSLFYVPYVALGAELSDDYRKRSTIVAFRVGIGVLGSLSGIVLAYGVFLKGPGGLLHRAAYSPLAWCCASVAVFGALVATLGTLGVRGRLHQATASTHGGLGRFFSELNEVRRNPSFVALFVACLLFFIGQGMYSAMSLHAYTYFWKLPSQLIQLISVTVIGGVFLGLPIVGVVSRRVEKRTLAIAGMFCIGGAQFAPVLLRLAGVIPPDQQAALVALLIAGLFLGIGVSAATVGFQSMMADAADEHEHRFHARREGLYFAGITFSAKASSGIGVLIAGVAMDLIRFPDDLAAKHVIIPAETVRHLGLVYGPGAAIVTLISVLVVLRYRLNQQSHAEILKVLTARRQIDQVPGAIP